MGSRGQIKTRGKFLLLLTRLKLVLRFEKRAGGASFEAFPSSWKKKSPWRANELFISVQRGGVRAKSIEAAASKAALLRQVS